MKTLTREEFKQKYGEVGLKALPKVNAPETYGSKVADAAKQGTNQFFEAINTPMSKNPLVNVETSLKAGAGAVNAISSPIAPLFEPLGKAINAIGNTVSDSPELQKFAMSPAGAATSRVAEDVLNASTIAGAIGALKGGVKMPVKSAAGTASATAERMNLFGALKKGLDGTSEKAGYVQSGVRDIIPTKQRYINHQVSKGLDLTPGDLNNISRSTGNDVGQWLSDNNLIGLNKASTQEGIQNFGKANYDSVRAEIGKVDALYKPTQVPRLTQALNAIQSKTKDVPGLENVNKEIGTILKKKQVELVDVQRVKELMDDHFNLYKVTGDIGEGIAKEGLANVRKDLQVFIEKEVKKTTGADIREMNKNVSTAKSLSEAITTRDPKGLTRSNLNRGDLALAFFGFNFPLIGIPAFVIKKIYETPTARLRVARLVDQWSDAQKAKATAQLKNGTVPKDIMDVYQQDKDLPTIEF